MEGSLYILTEAPEQTRLKVAEVAAGKDASHRLNTMGLHIGDILIKLNNSKWGPQLVQNLSNSSTKIAIGRGFAEKITVEVMNNEE